MGIEIYMNSMVTCPDDTILQTNANKPSKGLTRTKMNY